MVDFIGTTQGASGVAVYPSGTTIGDLAVVWAYKRGSDPPAMGSGWTELVSLSGDNYVIVNESSVQDHATLNYQVLPSGSTTVVGSVASGTFVHAEVFRDFNPYEPIGNFRWWIGHETAAGIKSIRIPRLVPQIPGRSWVAAFATQDSAVISGSATTGLTARTDATNKFSSTLVADTANSTTELVEGLISSVGGQNQDWLAASVEIRDQEDAVSTNGFVLNNPDGTPPPGGGGGNSIAINPSSLITQVSFPVISAFASGPPGGGGSPSGKRIDGPASGFTRLYYTDFLNNQPLGAGIHPQTATILRPRPNEAGDGTFWDSSQRGNYNWTKTTSEEDSKLRIWLHTEQWGQTNRTHVANPTGQMRTGPGANNPNTNGDWINYVSAPLSQANQRWACDVHFTARYPTIDGRKMAHLLWAGGAPVGAPGYGEEDFPEGKLDGGADKGNGFHHHWQSHTQQSVQLHTNLQNWHYYKFRFWAQGYQGQPGYVEFWLDGVRYGPNGANGTAFTTNVPPDDMYFVLQIETYLKGQTIPLTNIGQGYVEYDEYAFDVPTSGMGL
jgi:hypothetical protein